MMRINIVPYKRGSASARALRHSLGGKVRTVQRDSLTYRARRPALHLNWGCALAPDWPQSSIVGAFNWLNLPSAVHKAANKLTFFETLSEEENHLPPYTTSKDQAYQWLEEGKKVVARLCLTGSGGRGIVLVEHENWSDLPDAPLYTQYIKKGSEWRVHVFRGQVIDLQKKMLREGSAGNNFQIRNHSGGWIYARGYGDGGLDSRLSFLATQIVGALGLDFGAVDIIYNRHQDKLYVLEVNTAPGLVGTTLDRYTQAINQYREEM